MEKMTRCLGCMNQYNGDFEVCPLCAYIQNTPAKEVYHMDPGTMIAGRYQVGQVAGSGGFGITYIGYDLTLEKRVAIKEYLPSEFATRMPNQTVVTVYSGEKQEQFEAGMKKSLDEAKRLAEFQQAAGITQIYDFFEENNTAYIVMEYLEGETLKARLSKVGKMSVEEALPIILAVLGALKIVHKKDIIHRDIAPDNIYLLSNGEVKLLDFGASRQVTTTHSKSLTVILKPGYAPMEQYQSGGKQGPWTDIYALAATFYRMITGIKPPEAPERRMKDTLKEPSKKEVVIDKNVENALLNALQVRIEDRTKSAEEFESALYSQHVELREATVEHEDMGRWPFWLKAVSVAAASVVLITGGLIAAGRIGNFQLQETEVFQLDENMVRIPNLINMSQENARTTVEEAGLIFAIGDSEASDLIEEGRIIGQQIDGQDINAGATVERGTTLYVTVSSGKGTAEIPDVQWMKQETAVNLLKESKLIVINYETDEDTWAAPGTVTSVEPDIGETVDLETKITLKIAAAATGMPDEGEVTVPDITGMSEADAYKELQNIGLYMEKKEVLFHDTVVKGAVLSQQPGTQKLNKGETVVVSVSAGIEMKEVPYLVNETEENARTTLENRGLAVEVLSVYDENIAAGVVISQNIEAGREVAKGQVVQFTVSMGAEPVTTTAAPKTTAATRPQTTTARGGQSGGGTTTAAPPETAAPTPAPETPAPTTAAPTPTQSTTWSVKDLPVY
ncbi:MAG: PASTA domain-containing protein [Lachnospiraceae bacterium]